MEKETKEDLIVASVAALIIAALITTFSVTFPDLRTRVAESLEKEYVKKHNP